jgi:ribosomal protein L11 methyltransferase
MNTIEILIETSQNEIKEALIAELSVIGFEGFEESGNTVKAYIGENEFEADSLNIIVSKYNLNYSKSIIEEQNWNAVWESNFNPVVVDDFVAIRADFHQSIQNVQYEIVITPKMSFGTGHHATTFMVMQLMKDIDFQNKTVFDFGTGTGILAILAEKLGASEVLAVDNDDWCIENSLENIQKNNCKMIDIQKVDNAFLNKKFDIVIANINKNIILDNIDHLKNDIVAGGTILLSGLLQEDEVDIIDAAKKIGWQHIKTLNKGMWIAMEFKG